MTTRRTVAHFTLIVLCCPCFRVAQPARADDVAAKYSFNEKIVAGGPGDFMEARHLVLRGTQYDIGRKLAEVARDRFGVKPTHSRDALVTKTLRRYIAANYPSHLERMRGAAAAFGKDLDDNALDFSGLPYLIGDLFGCSVVFYPPSATTDGHGILSRNYDFNTGVLTGGAPPKGKPSSSGRPFVIEAYPTDRGYPCLFTCAYDLLGSAIDGVNGEGLCVALLADDEVMKEGKIEPTIATDVGLDVTQVARFLLDTCADCEQAKSTLLSLKQYYSFIPCHYIVADRHGKSFVYEHSASWNRQFIIDGNVEPQITTNHLLHRHRNPEELPRESRPYGSFARFRTLREGIGKSGGKLTLDAIKANNACVAATWGSTLDGKVVNRTLWHALYQPDRRSLEIDFYLGDAPSPNGKDAKVRRSGYLKFELAK